MAHASSPLRIWLAKVAEKNGFNKPKLAIERGISLQSDGALLYDWTDYWLLSQVNFHHHEAKHLPVPFLWRTFAFNQEEVASFSW